MLVYSWISSFLVEERINKLDVNSQLPTSFQIIRRHRWTFLPSFIITTQFSYPCVLNFGALQPRWQARNPLPLGHTKAIPSFTKAFKLLEIGIDDWPLASFLKCHNLSPFNCIIDSCFYSRDEKAQNHI